MLLRGLITGRRANQLRSRTFTSSIVALHSSRPSSFRPTRDAYKLKQQTSLDASSRDDFWLNIAADVTWKVTPTKALVVDHDGIHQWFPDGTTNISYNALDRQVEEGRGEQVAIAYHSCVGGRSRDITYNQLLEDVSAFAGSLTNLGVRKGDR